jgi:hypothetical protein
MRSGRVQSWIKVECVRRLALPIIGFVPQKGNSIAAIRLGRHDGRELVYAGQAGTGFTVKSAQSVRERVAPQAIARRRRWRSRSAHFMQNPQGDFAYRRHSSMKSPTVGLSALSLSVKRPIGTGGIPRSMGSLPSVHRLRCRRNTDPNMIDK